MALLGWLRESISWLNEQGGFTQSAVLLLVSASGTLLWTLAKWCFSAVHTAWSASAAESSKYRERLQPQRKMPLMEANDIEPKALADFTASIRRIRSERARFTEKVGLWSTAHKRVTDEESVRREFQRMAQEVREYALSLSKELSTLDSARQGLSDAWSSRMYWHDERGTAQDILKGRSVATDEVLELVARETDEAKESIDVFTKVLDGRTTKLDQALQGYIRSTEKLIKTNVAFEWICASVLDFKRRRSGVRGWLQRLRTKFSRSRLTP